MQTREQRNVASVLMSNSRVVGAANGVVVVSLHCPGQATITMWIHPITSSVESVRLDELETFLKLFCIYGAQAISKSCIRQRQFEAFVNW